MTRSLAAIGAASGLALFACGGGSSAPTAAVQPPVATSTPATTPTPSKSVVLPAGMVCPDPSPPPMLGMKVSIQAQEGGRLRLDSKPLVPNTDHYCEKVGFGDWKFCDTRAEGTSDRVACDYLVTGIAQDGRWGPTWYYNGQLCGEDPSVCVAHPDNQYLAIGKAKGTYRACAADNVPVAPEGSRCGELVVQ